MPQMDLLGDKVIHNEKQVMKMKRYEERDGDGFRRRWRRMDGRSQGGGTR